jgi:phospholipid/cholesterol/gamma-HCH transport system permease protein
MTAILESIGRNVYQGFSGAGKGMLLLRAIMISTRQFWKMRAEILEQMHVVLVGSMPLVIVTSIFVGAVTAVQAVYQMQAYVPMKFLGTVISKSVFIELGPVLMALVVGSRLCAFYAAELGTMKVTEQLDAMSIMAIDPVSYLAMPRFWASVLMIPVVTIFCDVIAIMGGYLASVVTLDVSSGVFIEGLQMFYKHTDLLGGLIKSVFFGAIIALSGIYFGFNTHGGAEGVGRSTMTAVVGSCLSVLVADYLLAIILFQIVFEK